MSEYISLFEIYVDVFTHSYYYTVFATLLNHFSMMISTCSVLVLRQSCTGSDIVVLDSFRPNDVTEDQRSSPS